MGVHSATVGCTPVGAHSVTVGYTQVVVSAKTLPWEPSSAENSQLPCAATDDELKQEKPCGRNSGPSAAASLAINSAHQLSWTTPPLPEFPEKNAGAGRRTD